MDPKTVFTHILPAVLFAFSAGFLINGCRIGCRLARRKRTPLHMPSHVIEDVSVNFAAAFMCGALTLVAAA